MKQHGYCFYLHGCCCVLLVEEPTKEEETSKLTSEVEEKTETTSQNDTGKYKVREDDIFYLKESEY